MRLLWWSNRAIVMRGKGSCDHNKVSSELIVKRDCDGLSGSSLVSPIVTQTHILQHLDEIFGIVDSEPTGLVTL